MISGASRLLAAAALAAWAGDGHGGPLAMRAQCQSKVRLTTELGTLEKVPEKFDPAEGASVQYPAVGHRDARYIRIRIEVSKSPPCPWYLNVRDQHYRLIQTITNENISAAGLRWTRRIPGGQAIFDLQPCGDGRQPDVRFDSYIWMPSKVPRDAAYYSWQGAAAAYTPLYAESSNLRRLGDFVGFLSSSWSSPADKRSWVCSGVMVTPSLLLTNWHCGGPDDFPSEGYWEPQVARDTLVDLSWDGDDLSRELSILEVEAKNESLDYAVLRVVAVDPAGRIRPIAIRRKPADSGEAVTIVHHAEGLQKQVSRNCTVETADYQGWKNAAVRSEFTHRCDTESGASGAPVLDVSGQLIGLHHLGFDFDPRTCKYKDRVNKAVRMDSILADLEKRHPKAFAELKAAQGWL